MNSLRKLLCWLFAISALICLKIVLSSILRIIHYHRALSFRNLLVTVVFSVLATVFGMAWFSDWKGKASGKWWGIAASLTNVLFPLSLSIYLRSSMLKHSVVLLGIGVAGLVAFSWPYAQTDPTARVHENLRIPGDGTSNLINSIGAFLVVASGLGAIFWWIGWLRTKGVSRSHGDLYQFALITAVMLVVTVLHEIGHTATGLALGMKLRAFVAGPFQWRIREGKWEFKFTPSAILSAEGATGVVPASAGFPRRSYICMTAAGPLFNLLTGMLALWIAFTVKADSPLQASGIVAFCGALSLAVGASNLLPFRTGDNYSDGAQIYQFLSDGPWADYHRAISVVVSSLVTPLRPKDYDIEAIQRAARSFTRGKRALLLRLFAYNHFFDRGLLLEAEKALTEAESIYHQSASDIPVELHTLFVFANAYLRRDAAAAREWWARMQTKKPTHFNVDYWRAYSALQWSEGNVNEANEAWEKSNTLAQQLPHAGEYEFDRYCCSKLRQALDEVL
jgi:hypothetical protein